MERHEIDLDNFIKEKIAALYPRNFAVEPTPDFAKRTMGGIYRLEARKRLVYGLVMLWVLSPLTLRQLWLLIRNDYFSATHLPFAGIIIGAYQFFLSWAGMLLLLVAGVFVSLFFVFKIHRGEFDTSVRSVKTA